MRTFIAALSFVASALAYTVSQPSASQGWTTVGPNTVVWSRVNTDALNFTILLVNQDTSILPSKSEVLSAFVDGSAGQLTVSPPSGGFPIGTGFQVNLVQDPQHLTTIYAQSSQFEIKASPANASSSVPLVTQSTVST
ncbi:hypothetical protein EWM64_g3969 [Hericium alpestre]|uniref:Yeast cell wall synthesis Kre9/Knh1-like N-terminal domain-containing protein n=1 Tax=Hericium alpestre TaxID=135208 RepID=A0A4Z0A2Y1_9AGAM|nr:hypothetical protein EWM64_g3969 [Hericium alpestre]